LVLSSTVARADAPLKCEQLSFNVSLTDGGPADQTMVAWLCARGDIQHKTIQIVLHGATYDHNYWNWPYQPDQYSYVEALTTAGYAVLNVDRIGEGLSSHPTPGVALTAHTGAITVHQVVQTLRSGSLLVPAFGYVRAERVMLVGHSMGSVVASIEAATYHDVDGVVLSAYAHSVGPGEAVAIADLYPAVFDPKFASSGLPFDYLTTLPGTRGSIFYNQANADPAVIALDEMLKGTATVGELADIGPSLGLSFDITAPTLIAVGDLDPFLCPLPSCTAAGFLRNEPSFFPQACPEVGVVPLSGHDVNLHLTSQDFFSMVRDWADRRVGASTKDAPPEPCH
jgi:pimeloyl-ACP methyl ester carboxylesterase